MFPKLFNSRMNTIYFLLLCNLTNWTNAELFTAIVDLENLLKTQKRVIDILDLYFHKQEKRLAFMKKYLNEFQIQHKKAIKDTPTYLDNPITTFILMKRLSVDLDYIEDNIIVKEEDIMNFTVIDKNHVYPTQEDLTGAAQAISRLQETYELNIKDLAKGKLTAGVYSTPMTAGDCYELGRVFHKEADYENVCAWMIEAFRKYTNEKYFHNFSAVDILEYIIFAYYSLGDMQNALKWTYTLLDIDPANSRAKYNLPLYSERIDDEKVDYENKQVENSVKKPDVMDTYTEAKNTYEAQCRGELIVPREISTRLTCRYMFENHAFLKIAPMKMETKYRNPDIMLFHDIISDTEIDALKQIATLKFNGTSVSRGKPEIDTVRFRVSKSAWLQEMEFDVAARISRRVADMTGLNLELTDRLQVVNYGIGGHYEMHLDTPSRSAPEYEDISPECNKNNEYNFATVMFYLSDVPLGGATVFTKFHLSVYPEKGAAIYWLNMHASGERNLAMTHASCPVLLGSKWVCTKWIPQCGQELIKPCNLVHQKETDANNFKIPRSIPFSANMLHDLRISILCSLIVTTNTEMFTSLVDLEMLPHTLKRTIYDLDNYISRREQKLYTLSRHADQYKTEHEIAMQNIPNYLENPIKAFTLIKQLTSDLDSLKRIMKTETENITKNHEELKYPVLTDLEGAAIALGRLQKTYNLTIKDLSNGNLNNAAYRPPLIASDCYVLGQVMLKDKTHIVRSLSWMIEALRKYNEENNSYSFTKINIFAYISRAYNILGDKKSALRWTEKVIEIDPTNFKARKKLAYYQKLIAEEEARTKVVNGIKDLGKEPIKVADVDKETDSYEALCRGEVVVPTTKSSRYFCHYLTLNHAFLKIAPIKMEVLYHNPDVILFYEVVSKREMELIKQTARPKFRRAKVHHPETGNIQFVDQRISKFAWILDKESDTIRRISRRVMHMTNLNMASAEPLQVVNYGIGGYFEPHCDFPPDIRYTKTGGDRIATVMFYLSDVTQGGATVFPELGLSVHPVKGAAIYWSNLNAEGGFEVATLHAGCPVLLGSKWVANKWIHRNGQTLFQVCDLSYEKPTYEKPNETSVKKSIMKDKQRNYKTEKERYTETTLK